MTIYCARAFFIGLVLALLLIGCGRPSAPITNKTATPNEQVTMLPSSPTAIRTPKPLPTDIPIYPGAQLVVSQYITTGALYFYTVMAPLQSVATFYINQMPAQGWKQESAEDGPQGNFYVYAKIAQSVTLNIVPDPIVAAKTDISITLSNS